MTQELGPESGAVTASSTEPAEQWRRVSPKFIKTELISTTIGCAVMLALTTPLHIWVPWLAWIATGIILFSAVVSFIITPRRVRAMGFQLRDDDLVFRKGILFLRQVAVPYGRMQLVDINRGPLLRAFGLSELKLVTAAAASAVTIPGLPSEEAEQLRDELVALAETRRAGL